MLVQRQVCHQLFEFPIFILQLLEAAQFGYTHTREFLFPAGLLPISVPLGEINPIMNSPRRAISTHRGLFIWWAIADLNCGPPACQARGYTVFTMGYEGVTHNVTQWCA